MKLRILRISPETILEGLKTGAEHRSVLVTEGIPAGAVITGTGINEHGEVFVLIQHESFQDLTQGQARPPLTVILQRETP